MPENRHLRVLLYLIYGALALLGGWLVLRFLLPWLAPFLLALLLSALLDRPVTLLTERFRLPRWTAAGLCTILLWGTIFLAVGTLLWRVGYETGLLLRRLPALLSQLPALRQQAEAWAYRLLIALPIPVQELAGDWLDGLISQGAALPGRFCDWLMGVVAGTAGILPRIVLFLFTSILATGLTSASLPQLKRAAVRLLPPVWRDRLRLAGGQLRGAFGGWLRAQCLLLCVTFAELAVGLLLLRVELALLLAALISLVDALPVFGVGTVLLPWALFSLLSGSPLRALGLLILYVVILLVRSLLEPRLVGRHVGLPPLAALLAIYLGFQCFGVAGMILFPLLAVLLKRLWDSGLFPVPGGKK